MSWYITVCCYFNVMIYYSMLLFQCHDILQYAAISMSWYVTVFRYLKTPLPLSIIKYFDFDFVQRSKIKQDYLKLLFSHQLIRDSWMTIINYLLYCQPKKNRSTDVWLSTFECSEISSSNEVRRAIQWVKVATLTI